MARTRPVHPSTPLDALHGLLRLFLARRGLPLQDRPPEDFTSDWAELLPALRRHRLLSLAHWTLHQYSPPIPAAVREELEGAFFAAALRHERLREALLAIGGAFRARGIPLMALKGMVLAETLYPEPACRPMEDLDLLVRPEDLPAAGETLIGLGYTDVTFGPEDFRDPVTGLVVDLHAELLNATRLPVRRLAWEPDLPAWWDRAHPFGSPESGLRAPDPADHLRYLCVHAWLHHGLARPLSLVDIALLAARQAEPGAEGPWPAALPGERRARWYALGACRTRLSVGGTVLAEALSPPDCAGWLERRLWGPAVRGRLPGAVRYAHLWWALPAPGRLRLLFQLLRALARRLRGRDD